MEMTAARLYFYIASIVPTPTACIRRKVCDLLRLGTNERESTREKTVVAVGSTHGDTTSVHLLFSSFVAVVGKVL
jgi:hypothetical protein